MAEIARKFLAHFINVTPSTDKATYFRLGKDLEDLSVELNPKVNTKENICGETSTKVSGYEPQSSVEPYYANKGDGLFEFLQGIADERKVLDDVNTDTVEVHLWEETGESTNIFTAYKESAVIAVKSYGGDTTGYQIPFDVHYAGDRVKGTFNLATKTFTADTVTPASEE